MKNTIGFKLFAFGLTSLTMASVFIKTELGAYQTSSDEGKTAFNISYDFDLIGNPDNGVYSVRAFVPQSNEHQTIESTFLSSTVLEKKRTGENKLMVWSALPSGEKEKLSYSFNAEIQSVHYTIDEGIQLSSVQQFTSPLVRASQFIESDDLKIQELAHKLKGEQTGVHSIISTLYDRVLQIPSLKSKELITAKETLEQNGASCNGKSRLFVALCRSLSIPSRVVGGIILANDRKKTSHLWSEVLIADQWVPFDPLNDHYAMLPANYLTIYKGDEYLIRRSADVIFDYNYEVKEIETELSMMQAFNMWYISKKTGMSSRMLAIMLLLPIGALIVAIFRNVIGLKTFGVFLPVLLALSFTGTGVLFGILSFLGVIGVISLLHIPLARIGILHVPKLVVMLVAMIFLMITLLFLGIEMNVQELGALTFFPVIILTITAEKYARFVVEEGFEMASRVMLQTLFVTLFCYVIVSSDFINTSLMNYPELLIIIAILSIMLGRWIGLRISEYRRFGWMIS